jgi:RNA polymerase sigma-70 factor (ECF subfamily)
MTRRSSEADTIARATAGDEAAQRVLYETHHAGAFRLATLLMGEPRDAEEVVQDAFVYLFRNLERYDEGRGSFRAWLRVALVSRCRNKRRRRRLALVSLEALDADGQVPASSDPAGDPAGMVEIRGTRRALWEALQRVSPGARDALILRYYEGLPYAEIATALGCSNDAARARVAHGKAQLRRMLAAPTEGAAGEREMIGAVKA